MSEETVTPAIEKGMWAARAGLMAGLLDEILASKYLLPAGWAERAERLSDQVPAEFRETWAILERGHALVPKLVAALEEAVEFQGGLNYMRHGTDELVPDGSIPHWYLTALAALREARGETAEVKE